MDTISDNAANAGIILGGRPIKPQEVDLRWVSALLYKNAVIEETGVAAGVLNHPAKWCRLAGQEICRPRHSSGAGSGNTRRVFHPPGSCSSWGHYTC